MERWLFHDGPRTNVDGRGATLDLRPTSIVERRLGHDARPTTVDCCRVFIDLRAGPIVERRLFHDGRRRDVHGRRPRIGHGAAAIVLFPDAPLLPVVRIKLFGGEVDLSGEDLVMRTVPRGRVNRMRFYETHVPIWVAKHAQIKVEQERIDALAELTSDARQAFNEQIAAIQTARAATQRFNSAIRKLAEAGGAVMMQIRSNGRKGDEIFTAASIPRPAKKSPIGAPGHPYRFKIELHPTGDLMLRWRCDNPRQSQGTMYYVYRADGFDAPFNFLGSTGVKKFIDQTIRPGTGMVVYRVQAIRTTAAGTCGEHMVRFGAGKPLPTIATKRRAA